MPFYQPLQSSIWSWDLWARTGVSLGPADGIGRRKGRRVRRRGSRKREGGEGGGREVIWSYPRNYRIHRVEGQRIPLRLLIKRSPEGTWITE